MMETNSSTAIMICGHGSHDDGAVEEFNKLAHHMRERLPQYNVESGFLEFATPVPPYTQISNLYVVAI